EDIHRRARRLGVSVDSELEEVRRCADRIESIEGALGVGISSGWDAGVPLFAPEKPVRGGEAAGQSLTESGERESLESEWRAAAARWRDALEQIEQLQLRWRALLKDRVEVE